MSYLTFQIACEYARIHPENNVLVVDLCPQACVVAIAIEVGTQTQQQVRHALLADNWLYQRGQPLSAQGDAIRQQMKGAFFVDTPAWREGTFQRAMQLWRQALDSMRAGGNQLFTPTSV